MAVVHVWKGNSGICTKSVHLASSQRVVHAAKIQIRAMGVKILKESQKEDVDVVQNERAGNYCFFAAPSLSLAFVLLILFSAAGCSGVAGTSVNQAGQGSTLSSITVIPSAAVSLPAGQTQQYNANGAFSDNSVRDVTAAVTWSSTDSTVASISNTDGSRGLATALAVGQTQITATDPTTGISSSEVSLTVTDAVLVSVAIQPAGPLSISVGGTQQFKAIATFSDSSTSDLTSTMTWASSDPSVASVSNAAGSEGLATGLAVGQTQITATDPSTGDVLSPAILKVLSVSPSPLLTYTAISDRTIHPKPALPSLGPAGSIVTDPTFGMRLVRVTDGNTRPDRPARPFFTPSSGEQNTFNTNSTYFHLEGGGGEVIPYSFDPVTMTASRIGNTGQAAGGDLLALRASPTFSFTDANLIYGMGGGGNPAFVIRQYDFATDTYTTLLNPSTLVCPSGCDVPRDLSGTTTGDPSVSRAEEISVYFGGTGQNQHMLVIKWNKNTGTWKILDTQSGIVYENDGSSHLTTGDSLGYTLHNSRIDKSGRYVHLVPSGQPIKKAIWDTQTDTITNVSDSPSGLAFGHKVDGYGRWVNHTQIGDAFQWHIHDHPDNNVTALIVPLLPDAPQGGFDTYLSWNNARQGTDFPVLTSTFDDGYGGSWRVWQQEIIAIATDGSGTVWRFCHTRSSLLTFRVKPILQVSQDGRFAMFTSDWEDTLGGARGDVFVVELK